ncbi:MAG: histidine ammonia-lyase [Casimicrobiaceae bacterium]
MKPVELSTLPLTLRDLRAVARGGRQVAVGSGILDRLGRAREAVLRAAASGQSVYGLTSALGANTGRKLASSVADETALVDYQLNAIRARSVGIGTPFPSDAVRAMLFTRIAGMRMGGSGISPPVFEALVAMLNARVHPIVPGIGSIGVGDLAPLSALALPLIGEGRAEFRGTVLPGAEAMRAAGVQMPKIGPKDGLSLVSSNAATIGVAALCLIDVEAALDALDHSAALAFEGFRANLSPLDPRMQKARPAPGQTEAAERLTKLLVGSALWQPGAARRVQDPLSFRCIAQVHGAARAAWNEACAQIELEFNSAADSPLVLDDGQLLSNGNFHVPALSIALEALGLAIAQCASLCVERSMKLLSPAMSELPLHLTRHGPAHSGFATVQKTKTALYNKIRHLANPACLDFLPVSERIEDHATMAINVVDKTAAMIEPLTALAAIDALLGAQAVDLRDPAPGKPAVRETMGQGAGKLYAALRAAVPMLDTDRPPGPDIETAIAVLRDVVRSEQ